MRIFIGLALIICLYVKIRADENDIFATALIEPDMIEYLGQYKSYCTPDTLSKDIPNAQAFRKFFKYLSENFDEAFETLEIAQFFVSAVQPSEIVERFDNIIADFHRSYQSMEPTNRETLRESVISTRNKLNEYADEIKPFEFVPILNGTHFVKWVNRIMSVNIGNVGIDEILAAYLKHVNDLIRSIQKSIRKSHRNIKHGQLKRLGTKIRNGVDKFYELVDEADDVSTSLTQIDSAINELRNENHGKYFNDMKTNAEKILNDLNQLNLLMEKQWTDMEFIFHNLASPKKLPSVTLAN